MKTKELKELKPGDMVILHTGDTRYEDEEKFVKSVGPKWITLEHDYPRVKYSILDGMANDLRPGYMIFIPKSELEEEWYNTFNYLLGSVVPRYLETLSLSKLKHLQKRWTNKILDKDEDNSTV